jgi:hypothetical protein
MALYGLLFMSGPGTTTALGGALSNHVLLIGFEVAVLYISWQLLTFRNPVPSGVVGSVSTAYKQISTHGRDSEVHRTHSASRVDSGSVEAINQVEYQRTENDPQQ